METDETPSTKPTGYYGLLRETVTRWIDDDAPMMGAALAYYALFSIAPMLMVAVAIAGMVFGEEAARGELQHHLESYFGTGAAESIQGLLTAVNKSQGNGAVAVAIGIGVLLFGASSVFSQLKAALNRIWQVEEPRHSGIKGFIINRGLAVLMVIGVGVLLLGSIVISAVIKSVTRFTSEAVLPVSPVALNLLDIGVMLVLLWVMFAIIFRYLPDVRSQWRSVALGAGVTAGLFLVGRYAISLYIAKGGMATGYGAASSVLVLLVWIYYSAQIFLFGAEFTAACSRSRNCPTPGSPADT